MKKNEPSKVVRSETLLFIPLVPFILFYFSFQIPPLQIRNQSLMLCLGVWREGVESEREKS
jgi:hypothetical protein